MRIRTRGVLPIPCGDFLPKALDIPCSQQRPGKPRTGNMKRSSSNGMGGGRADQSRSWMRPRPVPGRMKSLVRSTPTGMNPTISDPKGTFKLSSGVRFMPRWPAIWRVSVSRNGSRVTRLQAWAMPSASIFDWAPAHLAECALCPREPPRSKRPKSRLWASHPIRWSDCAWQCASRSVRTSSPATRCQPRLQALRQGLEETSLQRQGSHQGPAHPHP